MSSVCPRVRTWCVVSRGGHPPPPESNKGGYGQVTSSLLENFFKFFFPVVCLLDMSTGLRKNSFDFFFLGLFQGWTYT